MLKSATDIQANATTTTRLLTAYNAVQQPSCRTNCTYFISVGCFSALLLHIRAVDQQENTTTSSVKICWSFFQVMQLRLRGNLLGVWHFASWIINHTFSAPDSDSEEQNSAQGGWPPLSGMRSHGNLSRKRRSASSPTTLLSSQRSPKKKHKHLSLLLEEADLSSSDDSFDQGYWPNLTAPRRSLSSHSKMCLWASAHLVSGGSFFSDSSLARPSSTSLAAGFCAKVAFKKRVYQFLWCFYCLDCKLFSVAFVH